MFKDYLSPAAQVAPAPGRAHRRYTAADVQLLTDVGKLRYLGYNCDEVKRRLPPPARSDEPDPRELLAQRDRRLHELEEALARARVSIGASEDQAEQYERRLEAERTAHAETRRALLEAQRKMAEAERANARLIEANLGLHAQVRQLERELHAPMWQRVFRS